MFTSETEANIDRFDSLLRQEPRPTVSVIVLALNEAESLPYILPRIPDWVDEILLVDGHSSDDTTGITCDLSKTARVVMQQGRGKGAAIRSGFAAAKGDIVVTLDADGSTDPKEIPAFVGALLSGADFAKGSRFVQGGGTADMPFHRRLANQALVALANLIAGTQYTDITYGYNATWRRHAARLGLDIDGWANEIITNLRAARGGLHVVEVASFEHKRIGGKAKLAAFSAGWAILKAMLREPFRARLKDSAKLDNVSSESIMRLGTQYKEEPLETWLCDRSDGSTEGDQVTPEA
jgi:glycosyltransferase involved in cell wall biosynthesis